MRQTMIAIVALLAGCGTPAPALDGGSDASPVDAYRVPTDAPQPETWLDCIGCRIEGVGACGMGAPDCRGCLPTCSWMGESPELADDSMSYFCANGEPVTCRRRVD